MVAQKSKLIFNVQARSLAERLLCDGLRRTIVRSLFALYFVVGWEDSNLAEVGMIIVVSSSRTIVVP